MITWAEFTGKRPPDVKRAWAAMHSGNMALGSVFEMRTGQFKAIYSRVGAMVPTVDGPYASEKLAKDHIEFVVAAAPALIQPRPVILDRAFM